MKDLTIPVQFFKALEKYPSIYRLMWMKWLAQPDLLFMPTFCEKTGFESVPIEKIKDCYAVGMRYLGEGFLSEKKQKKIKRKANVSPEVVAEIVAYLNHAAGTDYRPNSKQTIELISARINDGFNAEHFFKVIDKKVAEWKGTERAIYLRPITLFSPSKFESYLNQPEYGKEQKSNSAVKSIASAVIEAKQRLFD